MILNINTGSNGGSTCTLAYDEMERWLSATWKGHVNPIEAQAGAEAYLRCYTQAPSALLLNDNSQLQGPWFDSLDWLGEVWVPQAKHLGLRYVAHVVQAEHHADILSARFPKLLPFELQIFQEVSDAQQWLRQCRDDAEQLAA